MKEMVNVMKSISMSPSSGSPDRSLEQGESSGNNSGGVLPRTSLKLHFSIYDDTKELMSSLLRTERFFLFHDIGVEL